METISIKDKSYELDAQGFLIDYTKWDEDFAVAIAPRLNIFEGLSEKHWEVIRFIRDSFKRTGICPLVYETCRANKLTSLSFKKLFPTGYLRGACLISGITYKDRMVNYYGEPSPMLPAGNEIPPKMQEKIYQIDAEGFLINPLEWDKKFALTKASEMKIPGGLTDQHWKIVNFLRNSYRETGKVPTFFECCEANNLEIEGLEKLFPDGYHRGAVKISGLRVR